MFKIQLSSQVADMVIEALTGIDPDSGQIVALFNPRKENWDAHFRLRGTLIVGLTSIGCSTVRVLVMNAPDRIQLRAEL